MLRSQEESFPGMVLRAFQPSPPGLCALLALARHRTLSETRNVARAECFFQCIASLLEQYSISQFFSKPVEASTSPLNHLKGYKMLSRTLIGRV